MRSSPVTFAALTFVALAAAPAFAQPGRARVRTRVAAEARMDGHVVLVVESARPDVRADVLRDAVTRSGITVVALTDERAASAQATLSIAVPEHGRTARVVFVRGEERRMRYLHAGRDAGTEWLVRPVVAFLREALLAPAAPADDVPEETALTPDDMGESAELPPSALPSYEVLNPWGALVRPGRPETVLAGAMVAAEVLNPWSESGRARARNDRDFLGYVAGEVLDPWAIDGTPPGQLRGSTPTVDPWTQLEDADALAAPSP